MQMNTNGHVQRSAVEWHGIITRYRQSGMGTKQFCAQEGLTLRRFEEWYRRIRREMPLVQSELAELDAVSPKDGRLVKE